jgi:GNAT superfamily N-acetyltransferase
MRVDLPAGVEIRPLRDGDLENVDADSEQTIHPDHVRQALAERGEDVVFLLALRNGRPIGRLGIDFGRKASEGVVHLWAFGVVPSLQRRGIGTAMMRMAEALVAAEPRGAKAVDIGVDEWNDAAAKLYRRLGYRDAGAERGSKGEMILLLRRPVSELGR